jgi:hypothetical protein
VAVSGSTFLTDGWFGAARQLSADLPVREGCGWRLQLGARDGEELVLWHQVVEDGRVAAWAPGVVDHPDLEVRWPLDVARGVHRRAVSGTEALAALRIVFPGGVEGPAPPQDIVLTDEVEALPVLVGATFTVQYEFRSGPFGDAWFWMSFVDGRVGDMAFERIADPDVEVHISYQSMAGVRAGAITILEALEDGGTVVGDVGPLMLLAGMQESPELHAAELACGPAGRVLADIGSLAATPAYGAVLGRLAEVTS